MEEERAERRLYREPEDKRLAGVCSGLADYLGLDPTVVRLFAVSLVLIAGVGVVVYLIGAIVIPERPASVPRTRAEQSVVADDRLPLMLGLLLVAVALVVVSDRGWFSGPLLGATLVGIGIWLLMSDRDHGAPDRPRETDEDEKSRENINAGSVGDTTLVVQAAPEREISPEIPPDAAGDPSAHSASPQGEVPPPVPPWGPGPQQRDRLGLAAVVVAILLITAGVLAQLALNDVVDLPVTGVLGVLLLVVGLALVVGGWWGQARPLIGVGVPVMVVLLFAQLVDVPLDAGTESRTVEISSLADLREHHELLAGHLTIDLRRTSAVMLERADLPELNAEVGFGELTVLLPPDGPTADIRAHARVGKISVDSGRRLDDEGVNFRRTVVLRGAEGAGRVRLDLQVGIGDLRVDREPYA